MSTYNWTSKRWRRDVNVSAEFEDGEYSVEVRNDGVSGFMVKVRVDGMLKHACELCHRDQGLETARRLAEGEYEKFRGKHGA